MRLTTTVDADDLLCRARFFHLQRRWRLFGPLMTTGTRNGYWIPFYDAAGDEIDINGQLDYYVNLTTQPYMVIYACLSDSCVDAYNLKATAAYIHQSYGAYSDLCPRTQLSCHALASGRTSRLAES